jgi:hypothetical protein
LLQFDFTRPYQKFSAFKHKFGLELFGIKENPDIFDINLSLFPDNFALAAMKVINIKEIQLIIFFSNYPFTNLTVQLHFAIQVTRVERINILG